MKKVYLSIFTGVIVTLAFFITYKFKKQKLNTVTASDEFNDRSSEPVLGIFDRNKKITTEKVSATRHYYTKWTNTDESELPEKLQAAISDDQDILLTIEVWPTSKENILESTINGNYDKKIKRMCSALSESKGAVYLRWNPEMEAPVHSYPWQWQGPELYIQAFNHFAKVCKESAPQVKIVWGPAGFPGDTEYWPGADEVDYISVTLEGESELLSYKYPKGDSVPDIIKLKLFRMRFMNKPIFVLGSNKIKKENFKNEWMEKAIADIEKDKEVIYIQDNFRNQDSIIKRKELLIGVYDPKLLLAKESSVTVEHIFTDWHCVKNGEFQKEFNSVLSRKHDVIVTMEPWKEKNRERDPDILMNVVKGQYDDYLKDLYRIISNTQQTVYLRWAHEMEIPITRYAWQSQDPISYIKAFRYVADFQAPRPKNIRMVWGPAGDRGSLEWYPGDDVVDYISIAIYGLPDKNITDYNQQEKFNDIFQRKYYRMRFVNKPIFITEFGVKGPEDYQRSWLEDAAHTINKHPKVTGICYFNLNDLPEAWGNIEAPDWSISKETFLHLKETLAEGN
jgi:beta-mannanase